jgi:hypothetical protein
MGLVLETILAAKQNITGGAFEALNPGTGDTFTIRSMVAGSHGAIEEIWGLDDTSVAQFSLSSPRMNDTTLGLRLALPSNAAVGPAEEPQVIFPGPVRLPVYTADTLRVRVDGVAGDNVLFAYTVRYDNLEASDVPLRTWASISALIEKTFGILVQPTNGTGDYGTPVTLNSADDRLEADKSYALLGATCDVPTGLITIEGPDTGRYRIGLPGKVDPVEGGDYFARMSHKYGLPYVPVIKALNAGSTLISTADANTGATPNITLVLAQLAGS